MTNKPEARSNEVRSSSTQTVGTNDDAPQTALNPPDLPQVQEGNPNETEPLDSALDEAVAQFLATPKSYRQHKTLTALAEHFDISRMTAYRRTKDVNVLKRVEWLMMHDMLAGDLIARRNWGRIVAAQVKAAIAGDTKAAQFCKERAWPKPPTLEEILG